MLEHSQFILGTAHIGNQYGLQAKDSAPLSPFEVKVLFNGIRKLGINYIDTALAYGQSQRLIGESINHQDWHIQTKIFANGFNLCNIENEIVSQISACRRALKTSEIHTILIHDAFELDNKRFIVLSQVLDKLVLNKSLERWGISIYSPKDFFRLRDVARFSVVQMPLNIIDQRAVSEEVIDICIKDKIEFQARSIFLQGLLLSKQLRMLSYFSEFDAIKKYEKFLTENDLDGLMANLSFLNSLGRHVRLVIGARSIKEATQILKTYSKTHNKLSFSNLFSSDLALIDPRLWDFK